jgi:hypothetical protein
MRIVRSALGLVVLIGALAFAGTATAQLADKLNDKNGPPGTETSDSTPTIDFGDDASNFSNDGECDDPRFTGDGASKRPSPDDEMHDATDCRTAYDTGTVSLDGQTSTTTTTTTVAAGDIDYGDDTSDYANDSECDDPRFEGEGVDEILLSDDLGHDATDCRALVESGAITLIPVYGSDYVAGAPYDTAGIDFGDDSSSYANNDECDDPRFVGPGMASTVLDEDILHDATDCEAAFVAGTAMLKTTPPEPPRDTSANEVSEIDPSISFGDNASEYANDGECDDPRFAGEKVADILLSADIEHDATDCRTLFDAGDITFLAVYRSDYADGAPYETGDIDFGDNTSNYAKNDECDDPRFTGPGMASATLEEDTSHDAADCEAEFVAGMVILKE